MGRTTATCMFAGRSVPARVMLDPRLGGLQRMGGRLGGLWTRAAKWRRRDGSIETVWGLGLVWGGNDAKA